MNMDYRMNDAADIQCSRGGSSSSISTLGTFRWKDEKERRCPRQFPHRRNRLQIRGTILFALALWVTEATLLLLQNSCNGFAPTGHSPSTRLYFLSPPQQQQKGRLSQKWEHSLHHLAAATTGSTTDDSSDTAAASISSILATENDKNQTEEMGTTVYSTQSTSFSIDLPPSTKSRRRRAWNFLKKNIPFWRNHGDESATTTTLDFAYDYDVIDISIGTNSLAKPKTTGIMLIHPIGVGIARWYYQRLVSALVARHARMGERLVIVVPDLLGSGSACNATVGTAVAQKLPLFNISDWTDQIETLMSLVEGDPSPSGSGKIDRWCVIANGGCSPIALQLAQRKNLVEKNGASEALVSNLILSSVPRLPFFLKNETTNDPAKVAKSYRTLSGVPGKLFWWYSCRNSGAFIQSFSEKNLIADPKNLGPTWRSNCFETAISFNGRGKYATFSFLAGTLQDGCLPSLEAIKDSPLEIDIIKGVDIRRNRAKSWFWQKPKELKQQKDERTPNTADHETLEADQASTADSATDSSNADATPTNQPYETFRDYAEKNGNGGRELVIGGRISLAHEDPEGYADAILQFL